MNPTFTKSYEAGAAINPCRILKAGSADNKVIQATDGAASFVGVAVENVTPASGDTVDVVRAGIAFVELGGTVTRGDFLKADASGKGVTADISAGTTVHTIGRAEVSGVSGDIIPVFITPAAVGYDGSVLQSEVTISSAELLALNATPKALVAAPGAGLAIVPVDVEVFLDYNSAAYAGIAAGENLEVRATDGSGQLFATIESDGLLDATADQYRHIYALAAAASTPVANAALVMRLASGEVTTGNSPMKVRTRYRVVDVAW
jgi:hypothetical protein